MGACVRVCVFCYSAFYYIIILVKKKKKKKKGVNDVKLLSAATYYLLCNISIDATLIDIFKN
jgi:hypothetical protein